MNRCDICLEETCKGAHNCHCDTCNNVDKCYRVLRPTIRITNRCTQECRHCCFSSSPKSNIFMSIDEAKIIAKFLKANDIQVVNLMGGEFFCNPDWFEILDAIISNVTFARLVTNGDWAKNSEVKTKLSTLIDKHLVKLNISISKDRYHTNAHVDEAVKFLKSTKVKYNVGDDDLMSYDGIVPIGRSLFECSNYGLFSCYCHNPANMYSFLIDENGEIYKCSFGVWNYTNVKDHLEGDFAKEFKRLNSKFYDIFISSCKSCIMSAQMIGRQHDEHRIVSHN